MCCDPLMGHEFKPRGCNWHRKKIKSNPNGLEHIRKKIRVCRYGERSYYFVNLLQLQPFSFEVGVPWLDWEERWWHVPTGLRSGLAICPAMRIGAETGELLFH